MRKKIAIPALTSADITAMPTPDLADIAGTLNRAAAILAICKDELKSRAAADGVTVYTGVNAVVTVYDIPAKRRLDAAAAEIALIKAGLEVPYAYSKASKGVRFK